VLLLRILVSSTVRSLLAEKIFSSHLFLSVLEKFTIIVDCYGALREGS
jgi:hypothetical protein